LNAEVPREIPMKLNCPHCAKTGGAGDLVAIETRGTGAMTLRTRRCRVCGEKVITCEAVLVDGFIPKDIRRAVRGYTEIKEKP
jgi:hypothetical protein